MHSRNNNPLQSCSKLKNWLLHNLHRFNHQIINTKNRPKDQAVVPTTVVPTTVDVGVVTNHKSDNLLEDVSNNNKHNFLQTKQQWSILDNTCINNQK